MQTTYVLFLYQHKNKSKMDTIFQASNSRLYVVIKKSSLDYYTWVRFLDNNCEALVMHTSDAKIVQ